MQEVSRDRLQGGRRDYTKEIISPTKSELDPEKPAPARKKPRRNPKKAFLYLLILIILAAGSAGGWWYFTQRNTSPVPKNIQKAVSFPIYYPDPKKLPAGYSLDTSSFTSPSKDVIVYTVNYGQGNKLIFSVQPKPSIQDINDFNSHRIPIHIEFQTKLGIAELGVIGNQAVVSLPTNINEWLIITGPQNLRESDISPVLEILKR
jgi:hypothetical protein